MPTKTKDELIDELNAMGVAFDDNSTKVELEALLNETNTPDNVDDELTNTTTKEETTIDNKGETVEIEKIQLENIMERLNELEGKKTKKRIELENRTCRIRLLNDKVVIGYGKSYEKKDISGNRTLMLEVITEDNKKQEVEFVTFNETGEQLECEIIETKKKEVEEDLGYVFKTKVNWGEYRTEETDQKIPLINKTVKIKYKLRLPDKSERWMEEEAIN